MCKLADPLMKVAISLARNILGITAASSTIDAGIKKNPWFWSSFALLSAKLESGSDSEYQY